MSGTSAASERSPSEALIDRLVNDLEPVRPVRLAAVYAAALLVHALVVITALVLLGLGPVAVQRLYDWPFLIIAIVLAGAGGLSLLAATRLAIPGRYVRDVYNMLLLSAPIILALAVVLLAPWGAQWAGLGRHLSGGVHCTLGIAMIALPSWVITLVILRRLGPLSPLRIGALAGLSAVLAASLVLQVGCPLGGEAYHLAISHYAPALALALAAAVASAWLLRRDERRACKARTIHEI